MFKEGKSIKFQTYKGAYGDTYKVIRFVQQFDDAFAGEHFSECSKLRYDGSASSESKSWWAYADSYPKLGRNVPTSSFASVSSCMHPYSSLVS